MREMSGIDRANRKRRFWRTLLTLTVLLFIIWFLTGCVGPRKWTTSDMVLEGTFLVETTADGLQSQKFVANCHEENPIIGECGDRVPLNLYIPLSALIHLGVAHLLPHGTARTIFLAATAGYEADVIYSNQFLLEGH